MFHGSIEFKSGKEEHSSSWGSFYVKGLEEWREKDLDSDFNRYDAHHSYTQYMCDSVPEGQVFSVYVRDGDKKGTKTSEFYICKVSDGAGHIFNHYTQCDCSGNFEVVAKGLTKTKAPRLMAWWNGNGEKSLALAERCAKYIDTRGQKELPAE